MTECKDGEVDVVENQPASITCTGLVRDHNVYWSLTGQSAGDVETRLGECTACGATGPCPLCSDIVTGYTMTRTQSDTTLSFTGSLQVHRDATVKCSSFGGASQTSCTLNVKGRNGPLLSLCCKLVCVAS